MKRLALFAVPLLTLVFGSAVVFAGDMNSGGYMNDGNMSTSSPGYGSGNTTAPSSRTVIIQNFMFTPSSMTVPAGTTVTWTNRDNTIHTVTGNTSGGPMSGVLQPGQSYSFTFRQAGTFSYHCTIHPTMTGTVAVTASPSTGGTTQPAPVPRPTTPTTSPTGSNSTSAPSAQATATANSSSTNNTYNNNYYSGTRTTNGTTTSAAPYQPAPAPSTPAPAPAPTAPAPSAPAAPATTAPAPQYSTPTAPSAAPAASKAPYTLPNTGAAGAIVAFVAATAAGTGLYYWHIRRKLMS